MHIVIGGADEVAYRLAETLMHDHDVVMIIPEEARTPRMDALDVQLVFGDGPAGDALRKARVDDAAAFVACSVNDERNLVACVAAKKLGAARTICFLFRRDTTTTTRDDDAELARSLGIDVVVRPAQQLADEIVRIVTVPGALDVEDFLEGRVQLLRHPVEDGAPITAGPLREIGAPEGVVLVMGRRGDEIFLPKGDTHFQPGDKVTAMGSPRRVQKLLRKHLRSGRHASEPHSATIVGGGAVGLEIARGLEKRAWSVKLIEQSRRRCDDIAPLIRGLVLHGDGGDLELLEQESVSDAAVLIAVTSNDEKNLLVSLLAKQIGVPRIVTRADVLANERLFDRVGVDVVRSARGAAIHAVARRFLSHRTELLVELEHGDAEVLDLTLPAETRRVRLKDLHQPVFAIIGAIVRGRDVIIPRGDDELKGGDHILVFCTSDAEEQVRDFFLRELSEPVE